MNRRVGSGLGKVGALLGVLLLAGAGIAASGMLKGSAMSARPACTLVAELNPATAMADHNAAAPENSVQFNVGFAATPATGGCAAPKDVYVPTMTSSDTVNVSLSSAGVARCIGTTTVPAVLTDTKSNAMATLTCK